MVIGWIYSRDLFETSWEDLHEVLPIFIAEESFIRVSFHLPQWRCYRNFEPFVCHTRQMWEIMASFSGAVLR